MSDRPWAHHITWSMCPFCGALHDGAANMATTRGPQEGDAGLCWACGQWTMYTADLQQRAPTDEEMAILMSQPEFVRIKQTWDWWHARMLRGLN